MLGSCAGLSSRQSLFGGDDDAKDKGVKGAKSETVSRAQYEQLLKKYDGLMKEKKVAMIRSQSGMVDETLTPADHALSKEQLVDDVVNQLANVKEGKKLSMTVGKVSGSPDRNKPVIATTKYNAETVESHMTKIRKADKLQKQNKFDMALTLIKELEKSPVRQIEVRAKYLLGEILFKQGEYDLAMQVYEEILTKYAYSGLVIKSLGRLIVCSDKLKQTAKQEKYYSFLHDFFEEGA
jgi:TolA-binding protein